MNRVPPVMLMLIWDWGLWRPPWNTAPYKILVIAITILHVLVVMMQIASYSAY
jgi:hypothetical protein